MISTYNILGKMENPLCVTVQRSAGFFYFATVKLGVIALRTVYPICSSRVNRKIKKVQSKNTGLREGRLLLIINGIDSEGDERIGQAVLPDGRSPGPAVYSPAEGGLGNPFRRGALRFCLQP
jgi:hypothetical protein